MLLEILITLVVVLVLFYFLFPDDFAKYVHLYILPFYHRIFGDDTVALTTKYTDPTVMKDGTMYSGSGSANCYDGYGLSGKDWKYEVLTNALVGPDGKTIAEPKDLFKHWNDYTCAHVTTKSGQSPKVLRSMARQSLNELYAGVPLKRPLNSDVNLDLDTVLDCGSDSVIGGTTIKKTDDGKYQFEYTCLPLSTAPTASDIRTVSTGQQPYWGTQYTDRRNLKCNANEAISKIRTFQAEPGNSQTDYTCVKVRTTI